MIGYDEKASLQAQAATASGLAADQTQASRHRHDRWGYQVAKRTFDFSASLLAIILLLPVYLIISIIIAVTEGMPVAFRQTRIGKGGKLFTIYKFRTMVRNAEEVLKAHPELMEEYKQHYKIKNDPRISKFGRFLRKSSLDELPQLFNVLKGEMSIVGPRPIVVPELEMYGDHQDVYLAMKPGCAGIWQCGGRSTTTYEERVEMDRYYYENASFWLDLKILVKTVGAILVGRGAR
jgi:exopolysaccharide production protein ExoY